MTPLSAFLPRLIPKVPGCSDPAALQALRDAAIEFCFITRAVRETVDVGMTSPGNNEYDLDLTPGNVLVQLIDVWCGERMLQIVPEGMRTYRDAVELQRGTPMWAFPGVEEPLRIHPSPAAPERIKARVAVRPDHNATEVMDELYTLWAMYIVAGAASQLMLMVSQPFSNIRQAGTEYQIFMTGVSRARVESNRGSTGVASRVRPVYFV